MAQELKQETKDILKAAHHWMVVLENPDVSVTDQQRFEAWHSESPLHADIYDRVVTYREAIKTLPGEAFDADLHKLSVRERMYQAFNGISAVLGDTGAKLALASTAMVVVAALLILPARIDAPAELGKFAVSVSHSSNVGEVARLNLADSSIVTLGASSEIRVSFDLAQRRIELVRGEAFFEVSPDPKRPFTVSADRLIATAIGTAFDVRSSGGIQRVTVAEGQVEVSHPFIISGQPTLMFSTKKLSPGQSISATPLEGMDEPTTVDPGRVAAWREGRLLYSGASLAEVVADANRYSSVPIEIEPNLIDLQDRQIRGVFLGNDVEKLLLSVAELLPVTVDRTDPTKVVLRSRD
ncbi:MAG: FecR domain-containing protein [Pseudomonadota bacterium]